MSSGAAERRHASPWVWLCCLKGTCSGEVYAQRGLSAGTTPHSFR